MKDHLYGDVFMEIGSQSNDRFDAPDMPVINVNSVKRRVGIGKYAIKRTGRTHSVMAQLKKCIVGVKAEENYLVHALLIAVTKVDNDINYKTYRQGRKIRSVVQTFLPGAGIDLTKGRGFSNSFDSKIVFGTTR